MAYIFMVTPDFESRGVHVEQDKLDTLRELIALFDGFPEEGVPVTTDTSGNWPPKYDNVKNYDTVATNVMRALHYMDSIVPQVSSPELVARIKAAGDEFYVPQDPTRAKTPRMVYLSEDIARLRTLLADLESYVDAQV